jgi:diguanylate cyclase
MSTVPSSHSMSQPHGASVAQCAKAALRRLALDQLEPTPENYARAYRQESGAPRQPALPGEAMAVVTQLVHQLLGSDRDGRSNNLCKALADGQWDRAQSLLDQVQSSTPHWANTVERVVRGVERGGKQWTSARKKESLQHVLDSSRHDPSRLQARLGMLLSRWESDAPDDPVQLDARSEAMTEPAHQSAASGRNGAAGEAGAERIRAGAASAKADYRDAQWLELVSALVDTIQQGLPPAEAAGSDLRADFAKLAQSLERDGVSPALVSEINAVCDSSKRVLGHRHHLVELLGGLCHELTSSLSELAESDSWAQGQADAMRVTLDDGITARGVKAVTNLLRATRERQGEMRTERDRARDSLKQLINRMLSELSELGSQTGRFEESVGRYVDVIETSESLESLTGVVREIVEESRAVQALVAQARQRMNEEHEKATGLTQRVSLLESELHRLSSEVSTDQLTQVANRRGLLGAFDAEVQRIQAAGGSLAMGLLDIDNFKRLNDELGHNAGDEALRALAAAIDKSLRDRDTVARYGGEEFVVLLPDMALDTAASTLTRLQRTLSSGLFLHEQKSVMVTFSAGVTTYREGERIEDALERADQALFEAKRLGKNRTCAT